MFQKSISLSIIVFLALSLTSCDIVRKKDDFVNVTGVTLDKDKITLEVGQEASLVHTIIPGNASIKDVVWTTGNPLVALVEKGKVTAKFIGTAKITVTTFDGSFYAACEVTVTNP